VPESAGKQKYCPKQHDEAAGTVRESPASSTALALRKSGPLALGDSVGASIGSEYPAVDVTPLALLQSATELVPVDAIMSVLDLGGQRHHAQAIRTAKQEARDSKAQPSTTPEELAGTHARRKNNHVAPAGKKEPKPLASTLDGDEETDVGTYASLGSRLAALSPKEMQLRPAFDGHRVPWFDSGPLWHDVPRVAVVAAVWQAV